MGAITFTPVFLQSNSLYFLQNFSLFLVFVLVISFLQTFPRSSLEMINAFPAGKSTMSKDKNDNQNIDILVLRKLNPFRACGQRRWTNMKTESLIKQELVTIQDLRYKRYKT